METKTEEKLEEKESFYTGYENRISDLYIDFYNPFDEKMKKISTPGYFYTGFDGTILISR